MFTRIFEKAIRLVDYIIFEADTEYEEYYNFKFPNKPKEKEIQVALHKGIRGVYWSCTCKNCSVHDTKNLCSYKLATLLFRWKVKRGRK